MSGILTPTKTEHGWVIPMTPEMAREANVAEGSSLIIYLSQDAVSAEVLPPVTDEIRNSVARSVETFGEALAEMKRLGD